VSAFRSQQRGRETKKPVSSLAADSDRSSDGQIYGAVHQRRPSPPDAVNGISGELKKFARHARIHVLVFVPGLVTRGNPLHFSEVLPYDCEALAKKTRVKLKKKLAMDWSGVGQLQSSQSARDANLTICRLS
jgi:hypothetical protein